MNKALKNSTYFILKYLLIILGKLFFRLKSYGRKNIPSRGGVLIAANHASNLDPFMIACQVPRQVTFFVKAESFKSRFANWWLRGMSCLPVRRGRFDRNAILMAIEALKNGQLLMFFPEGTRTHDGEIHEFKPGVGKIAYDSEAVVVPAYISGSYEAWSRHQKVFKPKKIRVFFGEPIKEWDLSEIDEKSQDENSKEIYNSITRQIEKKVKELMKRNASI